jgi:hypothetical protein
VSAHRLVVVIAAGASIAGLISGGAATASPQRPAALALKELMSPHAWALRGVVLDC